MRESKTPSAPIISQRFQSIWMEFSTLLRHVVVNHLVHLMLRRENPTYVKNINVGLSSDIYFRLLAHGFGLQI